MEDIPLVLLAGFWGFVAGSALVIGAVIGYFVRLPSAVSSSIMAFGIGVLVSALAFDLMEEAYSEGGVFAAAGEFVLGAAIYAMANASPVATKFEHHFQKRLASPVMIDD